MRHLALTIALVSGFWAFGLVGFAQPSNQNQPPTQTPARDGGENDRDYFSGPGRSRLFDRLNTDLDRATAASVPSEGDRNRVDLAKRQISEIKSRLDKGNYEHRDMEEAINAVQRILSVNRLSREDRHFLRDDLAALRELQAHYESGPR
jgi:hypothetical protein